MDVTDLQVRSRKAKARSSGPRQAASARSSPAKPVRKHTPWIGEMVQARVTEATAKVETSAVVGADPNPHRLNLTNTVSIRLLM